LFSIQTQTTCVICTSDDATPHGLAASGCVTVDVAAGELPDDAADGETADGIEVGTADGIEVGTAVDNDDDPNDGGVTFLVECDEHATGSRQAAPSIATAAGRRAGRSRRISARV
jgi:hypothetical protein